MVDGRQSPIAAKDRSHTVLVQSLAEEEFSAQLGLLWANFGMTAARFGEIDVVADVAK